MDKKIYSYDDFALLFLYNNNIIRKMQFHTLRILNI